MSDTLLKVRHLTKHFPVGRSWFNRDGRVVKAVDDVSFNLERSQTLGLVGESGCGKSTLGRALLRLHEPTSGQVILDGVDITALDAAALHRQRASMQIIFQDPYASLSPRRTVGQTLREPLTLHPFGTAAEHEERINELLDIVGLRHNVLDRYPHEFSGGQRQRIGIARALVLNPKLIVADEPVSALDVSVQSQVLNLIADLQHASASRFCLSPTTWPWSSTSAIASVSCTWANWSSWPMPIRCMPRRVIRIPRRCCRRRRCPILARLANASRCAETCPRRWRCRPGARFTLVAPRPRRCVPPTCRK